MSNIQLSGEEFLTLISVKSVTGRCVSHYGHKSYEALIALTDKGLLIKEDISKSDYKFSITTDGIDLINEFRKRSII